jgi:hypothetical protein
MCFTAAASENKARGPVVFGICQLFVVVFIKGFPQIAAPISRINRAKNAFLWSEKHDKAFAALKHAFTTARVEDT